MYTKGGAFLLALNICDTTHVGLSKLVRRVLHAYLTAREMAPPSGRDHGRRR